MWKNRRQQEVVVRHLYNCVWYMCILMALGSWWMAYIILHHKWTSFAPLWRHGKLHGSFVLEKDCERNCRLWKTDSYGKWGINWFQIGKIQVWNSFIPDSSQVSCRSTTSRCSVLSKVGQVLYVHLPKSYFKTAKIKAQNTWAVYMQYTVIVRVWLYWILIPATFGSSWQGSTNGGFGCPGF